MLAYWGYLLGIVLSVSLKILGFLFLRMETSVTNLVLVMLLLVLQNGIADSYGASKNVTRPEVVNVGALFGFSSIVGKVAKVAVLAAVEDVNSDPSVLGGTKLRMNMQDTNYSGFLGIVEG